MKLEIEHRFLVSSDEWRACASAPVFFRQGYLSRDPGRTVRVRLEGERGVLTIKGPKVRAAAAEFEYEIPQEHAAQLLETLCLPGLIEKRRYEVEHEGHVWFVDEFLGRHEGLVIAEVELEREDEDFLRPAWLGRDITGERQYSNASLSVT